MPSKYTSWNLVALTLVLLASNADGAEVKILSHPPQRPLPQAMTSDLTKGPVLYVDAAKGNDANDGSLDKPFKTLQHGVNQLQAGDTLYLREGVYHETVYLTQSGTKESPIVIAAYPGELPILDGGLPEFLHSPADSWEPLSGEPKGEYVSTKAYPQAARRRVPHQFLPGAWEPMWGIEEKRPLALGRFADSMVPLHGYRTLEDLRSDNEFQPATKNQGAMYCGPGMWFNRQTNRIHIRLAHNQLPGLNERAYAGETDPRKLPLIVAAGFGGDVLQINGVKHVRIVGLVLRGATGSPMIHVYGSEGIHLDHVSVYGGFPALLVNASHRIRVTHSAFRGLAAPWSGRSHMKYRGTASYQIVLQNDQPFNEDIEFAHCEFTDDHDFAFLRYAKTCSSITTSLTTLTTMVWSAAANSAGIRFIFITTASELAWACSNSMRSTKTNRPKRTTTIQECTCIATSSISAGAFIIKCLQSPIPAVSSCMPKAICSATTAALRILC